MSTWRDEMNARILAWLQRSDPSAVALDEAEGYGTDWAGDTEGGFYSEFGLTIRYHHADGAPRSREVAGQEMEDLWRFLLPKEAP